VNAACRCEEAQPAIAGAQPRENRSSRVEGRLSRWNGSAARWSTQALHFYILTNILFSSKSCPPGGAEKRRRGPRPMLDCSHLRARRSPLLFLERRLS
jgi:hypothetical protein